MTVTPTSIQLFYYSRTTGDLRHAWADITGWHFENLDGDVGAISHQTGNVGLYSAVINYSGNVQLYYSNQTTGQLRHAWTDANGWHFENLDGGTGSISGQSDNVGVSPAVTLLGNSIQLYYGDATQKSLRHAWTESNGWHFETLDGGGSKSISGQSDSVGTNPSVTIYNNSIELVYYDQTAGILRHAWANNTGWHFEDLDGNATSISGRTAQVGIGSAIQVYQNSLQVFYYDQTDENLGHAWSDSSGWHFENLGPQVIL